MKKEEGFNSVNFTVSMITCIIIAIVFYFSITRLQVNLLGDNVKNFMEIALDYSLTANAELLVDEKTKKEDRYHIILIPAEFSGTATLSDSEKMQIEKVTEVFINQCKKNFDLDKSFVPKSGELKSLNCTGVRIKKLTVYEAVYENELPGCKHVYDEVERFIKYQITFSNNTVSNITKDVIEAKETEIQIRNERITAKETTIISDVEFDISVFYRGLGENRVSAGDIYETNVKAKVGKISTTYTINETAWMKIWGKEIE